MIRLFLSRPFLGATDGADRVTLADIEGKFREMTGTAAGAVSPAKPALPAVAVAGGVLLLLAAYFFGRRKGRKRATVLEIRRVV